MIGAATELYLATLNKQYIQNATKIVNFVLANEVESTTYGNVLSDGSNSQCQGDCQEFKGPAIRWLGKYYAITRDSRVSKLITSSALAVWNMARNSGNLFSTSWSGPAPNPTDQVSEDQQNAAAMSLNIAAKYCLN